jgi:hypothetical protein
MKNPLKTFIILIMGDFCDIQQLTAPFRMGKVMNHSE